MVGKGNNIGKGEGLRDLIEQLQDLPLIGVDLLSGWEGSDLHGRTGLEQDASDTKSCKSEKSGLLERELQELVSLSAPSTDTLISGSLPPGLQAVLVECNLGSTLDHLLTVDVKDDSIASFTSDSSADLESSVSYSELVQKLLLATVSPPLNP